MEIIDVVRKLTGPIGPVGETHTDDKRFANLQARLELMRELHKEIDEIAHYNKNRHEFSMARAGKECDKYLDWLGILKKMPNAEGANLTDVLERDAFDIADSVIEEAYPNIYRLEKGIWVHQRIQNFGILRGAIARAIMAERERSKDELSGCATAEPNNEARKI